MQKYSSDKDINKLCQELEDQGWRIEKAMNNHLKFIPPWPKSRIFFGASTSGDWKNMEIIRKKIRHARREAGLEMNPPPGFISYKDIDRREREKKEARMQEPLKHNPIQIPSSSWPKAEPVKMPDAAPVQTKPAQFEPEQIYISTAVSKGRELMNTAGKTAEEALQILRARFRVVSPRNATEVLDSALLKALKNPFYGKRDRKDQSFKPVAPVKTKPIVEAATKEAPPEAKPVVVFERNPHSPKEIDETMRHIRAVIELPLPKEKRLGLIIDLLHEIL